MHLLSRLNKFLGLLTQSLLLNYVTVTLLLLLLSLFTLFYYLLLAISYKIYINYLSLIVL